MKNNKLSYIASLAAAGVLVASSVLMPGILLNISGDRMLNYLSVLSSGNNPLTQSTPSAQPIESVSQLTEKVRLFQSASTKSTLSNEYLEGSMGMSDAVDNCVRRITAFIDNKAVPSLDNFPQSFTVKAEPREIKDDRGNPALQYWNIEFTQNTQKNSAAVKGSDISISLDARTGMILAMHMSASDGSDTVVLVKTAEAITQGMNISGRLLSLNQQSVPQAALWKFDNSSLLMQLELTQRPLQTTLTMTLTVENESSSGVPAPVS